jgi:3-oxoacyl-(acyl-carrier-protein) synthase/malonyl CoA-acyl carrier protein transacylase/surfactin synthase thioesterase subunit/acyl carrier protein
MTGAVSVIGIGCRFPGGICGAEDLWKFLAEGRGAIGPSPARLRTEIPNARGGYIQDLEYFDYEFFGVSRSEALCMDPQQRVLAETVHEAIFDAGLDPLALKGTAAGVYVGGMDKGWTSIVDETSAFAAIGSHPALMANRISFFYDLKGPSMTCDVSCSGSLAAVYYAIMSLQTGDCDLAIAGGVNVLLLERFATSMASGGFLSKDFQCFTFDERANGYVQSEGCGVVILKRSADVTAGDRVYGEIVGQSFNEDGRTGCISTPSGSSQSVNIRRAMTRAGVNACELDFVQAHGTGTGVGDPIEIAALLEALATEGSLERPAILMHSIKQNLGHMELSAGIGSLIATLMVLRKGACPPNILVRRINPVLKTMLDEASARLEIPTELTPLRAKAGARLGLLGAFGYGGTNVHMVVRAEHGARPTARARPKWKRESALPWVCPAFIRKDDPSLVDGGPLADVRSGAAPSTAHGEPVIDALMTMLRELINRDGVEASRSPQELGLDSLSIIELVRLVHRRFGVVLDLAEVSRTPLATLAETVAAKRPQARSGPEVGAARARGARGAVALSAEQLRALGARANLHLPPGATDVDLLGILDGLGAHSLGAHGAPGVPEAHAIAREKHTLGGYLSAPSPLHGREGGVVIHHLISDETLPVIARTNRIFFIGFYLEMLKAAVAGQIDSTAWYIKYVHLYHILQIPSGEAKNVRLEHWLDRGDDYAWVTSEPVSRGSRDGGIFIEPDHATARVHACIRTRLASAATNQAIRQRLSLPEGGLPPYADPTSLATSFDHHVAGETILALMERFQSYKSSVEAKEAWFSKDRVLLRIGASGERWHMVLPTRLWDASILACQVSCLATGRFPVLVVDSLEDVAIDESGGPSSEYWIHAVADRDDRPRYPAGEQADSSTSRRSWANVWVFTADGRVVARMRQRMVQIHDVDLRDTALWTQPRPSALLLRLWQLEDSRLRQVVRSLLLSTIAFTGRVDPMSLDTAAAMDHRTASALQHRILSVLGVPVLARTRSSYEAFFAAVAAALSGARPDEARQRELAGAALPAFQTAQILAPSGATRAWVKGEDVPGTVARLFCLPYGSGSSESFAGWQDELEPSGIEVRPIEMPGRAERSDEAPIERADVFLRLFEEAITPLILDGKPYAFYGHSMGGALAYAWVRYAEERGLPLPRHVFVAGFPAFHLRGHWYQASSTPFQLRAISGIDSPRHGEIPALSVQALAEMFSLTGWLRRSMLSQCVDPADVVPFLPRILADHSVARECAEQYAAFRPLPKSVGLTALHAEHDDRVPRAEALAWTEIGVEPGQVRVCFLPGQDHFFCDSEAGRELAFEEIRSTLGAREARVTAAGERTLVLFPGQGSQKQKGFVDGLEGALEWRLARDTLGYDVLRICKESPERLASTRICQAAIYVASYVRWKRWAESDPAAAETAILSGFSLGEVTALAAAGVFTFEQGLALIRVRGEAMEQACRSAPSTMVTLVGLSREAVSRVVDELNQSLGQDVSWLCNHLWDEGFVVGTRREHSGVLCDRARAAGAQKAIELEVEGAFHTPLMRDAQRAFASALASVGAPPANGEPALHATVYSNVTGAPYETIAQVFDLLPAQICSPVRWAQILTHVKRRSERITSVILPSPGEQLAGMLKMQSQSLHSKHILL